MTFLLSSFFLPDFFYAPSFHSSLSLSPFVASVFLSDLHLNTIIMLEEKDMNVIEDRRRKFKGFRSNGTKTGRSGKTVRENREGTKLRLPV